MSNLEYYNPDKPVVFLDIDGVLNSQLWFTSEQCKKDREIYSKTKDFHAKDLDPRSIEILNSIADWNFVLSSTWRKIATLEKNQKLLDMRGFKGKLMAQIPELGNDCLRGNEIYKFINENFGCQFDRYVIFDDDSDMLLWQREHYFNIDGYVGITPTIIYKAKRFLKVNKYGKYKTRFDTN